MPFLGGFYFQTFQYWNVKGYFMKLSEKVKLVRKTEGYTQKNFSKLMGSGLTTITNYEGGHSEPNSEFMQKLCQTFPEYTLWLMTGKTSGDQIDPSIKQAKPPKTA